MIERLIEILARDHREAFEDFLGPDVTVVPMPKSAPLPTRAGGPVLWVPNRICQALLAQGLGRSVVPCVERVTAVPKSAFAAKGERPSIDRHIKSMRPTLERPTGHITLVDDVVTKGATFFGAATVIKNAFPEVEVRAFALIRTCGLVPDVERIIEPTFGTITRNRFGDASREP